MTHLCSVWNDVWHQQGSVAQEHPEGIVSSWKRSVQLGFPADRCVFLPAPLIVPTLTAPSFSPVFFLSGASLFSLLIRKLSLEQREAELEMHVPGNGRGGSS